MARPQLFSNDQLKDALEQANGQVYVAARILKASHSLFYQRFRMFPELREYAQGFKEIITDQVEQVLIKKAIEGQEPWAVTFWLKTQAKHRGYTERQEITGANGEGIKVEYVNDWRSNTAVSPHGSTASEETSEAI